MNKSNSRVKDSFLRTWFLPVQLVLVGSSVAVAAYWYRDVNHRERLPALNDRPRIVRPLYNYPLVVSDEQLAVVLEKLHPRFSEHPTKVNFVDHALRLWGLHAEFSDGSFSGRQMCEMLLDHQKYAQFWNADNPLLRSSKNGISVATQEGRGSVSHVDHLLGTLTEIGMPLSVSIRTADGVGTVHDLLVNSLMSFRLNQKEYEWTALSAAFFVRDGSAWYSREGQRIDFNQFAKRIMRQRQPQGVCYGQHRLYALTVLLRIDEQMRSEGAKIGLFEEATRRDVVEYLVEMTHRFMETQHAEGYWDGNWSDDKQAIPDPQTDPLSRQILATGHALEWWAMAPKEFHPPRETMVRAGQWLATRVSEMDDRTIEKNYTFLTHAARALALWRGGFAGDIHNERANTDRMKDLVNDEKSS